MKNIYGLISILVFSSLLSAGSFAFACHELTARDRQFWKEMYGIKKSFLYMQKPIFFVSEQKNVDRLNTSGISEFIRGSFPEAGEQFKRAIDINRNIAPLYHNLALVNYKRLKLGNAARLWEKAVALDPSNPRYHYHLAAAYSHDGKISEAIAQYSLILDLIDGHYEIFNSLGQLYEMEKEMERAIGFYEKAVALNPGHQIAANNLARLYAATGKLDAAKQAYTQLVSANPKDAENHINLGEVYSQIGKNTQALDHYKQAINLRSDYPYPRFMLAKAYRSMGMEKKALAEEKFAMRIRVDNYIGCIVDPTPDMGVPEGKHALGQVNAVQIP